MIRFSERAANYTERFFHGKSITGESHLTIPRLYGPFQLTEQGIETHLQNDSPGVYALGNTRNNLFLVSYVGRAEDLKERLRSHIPGPYHQFKFAYALSRVDAFVKQCGLYHDFVGLDNPRHPCPPAGIDLVCPVCRHGESIRRER